MGIPALRHIAGRQTGAEGPRITAQVAGQVSTKIGETTTVYAAPDICRLFATDGNERGGALMTPLRVAPEGRAGWLG